LTERGKILRLQKGRRKEKLPVLKKKRGRGVLRTIGPKRGGGSKDQKKKNRMWDKVKEEEGPPGFLFVRGRESEILDLMGNEKKKGGGKKKGSASRFRGGKKKETIGFSSWGGGKRKKSDRFPTGGGEKEEGGRGGVV